MAHGRYDLTEFEWNVIKPLLPNKARGVPRVDDRRLLHGIFFQLRSGSELMATDAVAARTFAMVAA